LLAHQVLADQLAHPLVGDPVAGADDGRLEATGHLVLAAGAGLEGVEAVRQAIGDALIHTELEVQAMVIAGAAPVPSPGRQSSPAKTRHDCRTYRRSTRTAGAAAAIRPDRVRRHGGPRCAVRWPRPCAVRP